ALAHGEDLLLGRVDEERHQLGAPRHRPDDVGGRIEADAPRRTGPEVQPQRVDAGLHAREGVHRGADATDLDLRLQKGPASLTCYEKQPAKAGFCKSLLAVGQAGESSFALARPAAWTNISASDPNSRQPPV